MQQLLDRAQGHEELRVVRTLLHILFTDVNARRMGFGSVLLPISRGRKFGEQRRFFPKGND
jgi:hypothetical protein